MEIGSFFELNPKLIDTVNKSADKDLGLKEVKKYKKQNYVYTASGREAISLVLKSIEAENSSVRKKCLLPAYMCDTVFFPFVQNGWELFFYHIDISLRADKHEIIDLIEKVSPTVFFIHAYFGADTWKELRPLLNEYRKKGIIIVEDVTQSYYCPGIGMESDYIVGSLRKWYSVPDGGFAASDMPLHREFIENNSYFAEQKMEAMTQKWKYLHITNCNDKEEFLLLHRKMENYLDEMQEVTCISDISAGLLAGLDEEIHYRRRLANYNILNQGFKNRKKVRAVFSETVNDAASLYFPVYADKQEEMQEFFRQRDIYLPVLWPIGKENMHSLGDAEQYIFNHILAVPMDHRYGDLEMQRIVDVLNEYEGSVGR